MTARRGVQKTVSSTLLYVAFVAIAPALCPLGHRPLAPGGGHDKYIFADKEEKTPPLSMLVPVEDGAAARETDNHCPR